MNKLLIIGILLFFSLKSFSTCIAIYIAPNGRIYVAADSRRTFYFNDKYKSESVCKIHNVGANYFAIAGIDDGGLLTAANTALEKNKNIDTAIRCFGAAMVNRYQRLMADARVYYPDKFRHFLQNGLADVSFFGYNNGEPYLFDVQFLFHVGKKDQIIATYSVSRVAFLNIIGISNDITNSKPEDLPTDQTRKENPQLYVESLVKIEAKKQPLAVSEPIDLLEISPDGPVWIRRNENAVNY